MQLKNAKGAYYNMLETAYEVCTLIVHLQGHSKVFRWIMVYDN